ncbi:MAG: hypothetical protein HW421_3641 [Ignavibacteria bacterium]|nr:hypothetical protein [Ignavibacteria bacterium]
MVNIQFIANELQVNSEQLLSDSLKLYLSQNLNKIESEIYLILKKFNVKDVKEFEQFVHKGEITENDGYDDFFKLDNLTARQEKLKSIIEKLND